MAFNIRVHKKIYNLFFVSTKSVFCFQNKPNISPIQSLYIYRFYGDQKQDQSKSQYTGKIKDWIHWHEPYKIILQNCCRKMSSEAQSVSQKTVEEVCSIFDLKTKECTKILHNKVRTESESEIITNCEYLKELGVLKQHISKAPWLINQTKDILEARIPALTHTHLFSNVIDGLGFSLFDTKLIMNYASYFEAGKTNYPNHRNKIYYVADKLNLPVDILTIKMAHAWKVLHLKKSQYDRVIDVLLDFDIPSEYIINDVWIFIFNATKTRHRLSELRKVTKQPLKLWHCRSSEETFRRNNIFERGYTHNVDGDMYTVLKQELKMEYSEYLDIEHIMRNRSVKAIYSNIRQLKEGGFSEETLREYCYLLIYCPRRTLKRKKLLEATTNDYPFYLLFASENNFKHYEEQLQSRMKK